MSSSNHTPIDNNSLATSLGAGGYTVVLSLGAAFNSIASPGAALAAGLGGGILVAVPVSIGVYKASNWALARNKKKWESAEFQSSHLRDSTGPNEHFHP